MIKVTYTDLRNQVYNKVKKLVPYLPKRDINLILDTLQDQIFHNLTNDKSVTLRPIGILVPKTLQNGTKNVEIKVSTTLVNCSKPLND